MNAPKWTTPRRVTLSYQPLPPYRGDGSEYMAGYLDGMADAQQMIERVLNSRNPPEAARRIKMGLP